MCILVRPVAVLESVKIHVPTDGEDVTHLIYLVPCRSRRNPPTTICLSCLLTTDQPMRSGVQLHRRVTLLRTITTENISVIHNKAKRILLLVIEKDDSLNADVLILND